METSIKPDEVLTEVRLPALDGYGFSYQKFTRRSEDWAMVAVNALVKSGDGTCEDIRITHHLGQALRINNVWDARLDAISAE